VSSLADALGAAGASGVAVVTIGPTTSAAARDAGFTVAAESLAQSVDGLVDAVLRSVSGN